jgi:predicted DNA-binding antitoxin AbrB/MazE fold protein
MTVRGVYRNGKLELEQPLDLPDGTAVEIDVRPAAVAEDEAWRELGMSRLEEEWDNPADAVYDDWRRLYGA